MGNNIPRKASDLLVWAQNFAECIKANTSLLNLDSKKVTEIQSLVGKYKTNLEKALNVNHTREDLIIKNAAKGQLEKAVKNFIILYLDLNPAVTPSTRSLMGLGPLPAIRGKSTVPVTRPFLEYSTGSRSITVWYRDGPKGRKAKPKGTRGITYRWDILDTLKEDPENLRESVSKTSGPLVLQFDENQRGKAIHVSARWEGRLGEPGPWSDTMKMFIA